MKCVMVINQDLPVGLIANTAAVLALSIGNKMKEIVGEDVVDQDGQLHPGITKIPIPLLKGDHRSIRLIRDQIVQNGSGDIFWVDFCDVAQRSKKYDEYQAKLRHTAGVDLVYLGIGLCGPVAQINKLTGSMALLR